MYFVIYYKNVSNVLQAQVAHAQAASQAITYQQGQAPPPYSTTAVYAGSALYPSLTDYMGLEITQEMVSRHAVVPVQSRQVCELKWFLLLPSNDLQIYWMANVFDINVKKTVVYTHVNGE